MKTIQWCEKKSQDWIVATLEVDGVSYKDVSINRHDKNGRLFPDFDLIAPGKEVQGEFWQSSKGKSYLYPPKAQTTPSVPYRALQRQSGVPIQKIIEQKKENIREAQENKEQSIRLASTIRMAVDMAIATHDSTLNTPEDLKKAVLENRSWLNNHWDDMSVPFE